MLSKSIMFAVLLLLAAGQLGCASNKESENTKINNWIKAADTDIPPGVYRIEPPDEVTILAPKIPELNNQKATVSPDGKLSYNLVGSLSVAGKTPQEVGREMARICAKYYAKDALDIAVVVTGYKSKFIYVFGQVNQPGIKAYTGRDSVLRLIAEAQLNERAWAERVVVVRPNEDVNIKQKVTLDLADMFRKGDTSNNILLEEGDVVYVPPTPLSQLNMDMTKILTPIRPLGNLAVIVARGGI